ncbi:MAG: MFS transporter [Chloroflexi bacterium]|nr:MFS transporter [Chloroflexota bacterium]
MRRVYYGWVLVATLGVTETISWGVLYYAFTVYLAPMQAELGWSRGDMTGAFSLALLVAGLAAIPVGRWLDRHGARFVMTVGSIAGTLLVLGWSQVQTLPAFYLIWAAIGLAMSVTLYDAAFATATMWFERYRVRALFAITLMAGFASTIFIPLAGFLVQSQGWRPSLVSLALVLAVGTIAPHALILRRRPEDLGLHPDGVRAAPQQRSQRVPGVPLGDALRDGAFRWTALALWLTTVATIAVGVHLVPYLEDRGYDPTFAAAVTGAIGAMQVLARLVLAPFGERASPRLLAGVVLCLQPIALLVLLLVRATPGVLVFVALFGAARGATTLVRPTLLAHLYGRAQYASIAGVMQFLLSLAQAVAPVGAGVAYDALRSYEPILWTLAALSSLSVLAIVPVRPNNALQPVQSQP